MKAKASIFGAKSPFATESKDTIDELCDQIRQQKLLPIISNNITDDLLFGNHEKLIEAFAEAQEYPFADKQNLARVSQYADINQRAESKGRKNVYQVKKDYITFLKDNLWPLADEDLWAEVLEEKPVDDLRNMLFTDFAQLLEMPNLSDEKLDTLSILTELSLPVYVTTSYHTFMEEALMAAGRKPVIGISYWRPNLKGLASYFVDGSYAPTPEAPLVYHLLGVEQYPESMVMTEDEHLDFLAGISEDWQWQEGIPGCVRQALSNSSLLLLGYNLWGWDFRVLLRGLIKRSFNENSPQSVSIQVREDEQERLYFQKYLENEVEFEVIWEPTMDLMQQIYDRWRAS